MSIELPAISIVIPAKNEDNRLPVCLNAIKNLDYNHDLIEIIVVDNGSEDNTCEVAKSHGCRIFQEPSLNVSGMRNVGALNARNSVLCFIDADVSVSQGWLIAAVTVLQGDDVGCATGELNIPDQSTWVERTWALDRGGKRNEMEVRWTSSMNMIVKKDVFNSLGGFSAHLATGEDVEFCERLTSAGYKIIWKKEISVIHFGEAKTLSQFVAKERWRGYSDLDLLLAQNFKFDQLRHGSRPIFFILSFFLLVVALFSGNDLFFFCMFLALISMPMAKTVIIMIKQRSFKNFLHLIALWHVYFFARSLAIFDNIWDRLTQIRRGI